MKLKLIFIGLVTTVGALLSVSFISKDKICSNNDVTQPYFVADNKIVDSLSCYSFNDLGIVLKVPQSKLLYDNYRFWVGLVDKDDKAKAVWFEDINSKTFQNYFTGVENIMFMLFQKGKSSLSYYPASNKALNKELLYYTDDKEQVTGFTLQFCLFGGSEDGYEEYQDYNGTWKRNPKYKYTKLTQYISIPVKRGFYKEKYNYLLGTSNRKYVDPKLEELNDRCSFGQNPFAGKLSDIDIDGVFKKIE